MEICVLLLSCDPPPAGFSVEGGVVKLFSAIYRVIALAAQTGHIEPLGVSFFDDYRETYTIYFYYFFFLKPDK
jgi:hypothetical protein